MEGYIYLYRELLEKPIWLKSTPEQKCILITILLMANHHENEWEWMGEKFKVMPGQFITSLESIKQRSGKGISIQNVRSCLKRFEKFEFLTNKSTKTGRLITVINWSEYQYNIFKTNKATNKEVTKTQQRGNKEVTPNNNEIMIKNDNNERNIYKNIVEHLNQKTGKSFQYTSKETQRLIKARLNAGFTESDFFTVIDNKCAKWFCDPKMVEFLRPQTLFGTKFESYLQDIPHPLQGKVSETTIKNIHVLENWRPKNEE